MNISQVQYDYFELDDLKEKKKWQLSPVLHLLLNTEAFYVLDTMFVHTNIRLPKVYNDNNITQKRYGSFHDVSAHSSPLMFKIKLSKRVLHFCFLSLNPPLFCILSFPLVLFSRTYTEQREVLLCCLFKMLLDPLSPSLSVSLLSRLVCSSSWALF